MFAGNAYPQRLLVAKDGQGAGDFKGLAASTPAFDDPVIVWAGEFVERFRPSVADDFPDGGVNALVTLLHPHYRCVIAPTLPHFAAVRPAIVEHAALDVGDAKGGL